MRYNKSIVKSVCFSILAVQVYYFLSATVENIWRPNNHPRDNNKTSKTGFDDHKEIHDAPKYVIHRRKVYMAYYRPIQLLTKINCTKILNFDENEISKMMIISNTTSSERTKLSSDFYIKITNNCSIFRDTRRYLEHPITKEETAFPIAFSIFASTNTEQLERLLRSIYRPHNYYCIHLDLKTNISEQIAIRKIANCLTNVFISQVSFNVTVGHYTYLKAELGCMKTVWPIRKWKYYINLSAQGFPLKTNHQIVAILKTLNGANIVDGSARRAKKLVEKLYNDTKIDPPHNIQLVKGSMYIAVNRHFVDFCLNDQRARDFLEWILASKDLEETFFASMNFNPHLRIPGSFLGEPEPYCLKPILNRYVPINFPGERYCHTNESNEKCMFSVEDLPKAYNGFDFLAFNFNLDYEPLVLQCLEEVLYTSTWTDYVYNVTLDTAPYAYLHYTKMQFKP